MSKETVISVKQIEKAFRTRGNKNVFTTLLRPDWQYKYAVKKATFSIARGESVAFLGPNGAGKTTTTKMMCGLIYPTTGAIEVLGYTPFNRDKQFLQRIGLVMGNKAALNWDLNARQAFWLLQKMYKIPTKDFENIVEDLTTKLKVKHLLEQQIRRLSLGERMKLELIAAILHQPEILFLDEPTIGLDIEAKATVRNFLRTVQREYETTLVLTSHDMDDIEEVCDRVLVIDNGRIVFDDSITKITRQYNRSRYVRVHFSDELSLKDIQAYGQVINQDNGILVKVSTKRLPSFLQHIASTYSIDDITIESVPLESIIASIFNSQKEDET